MQSESGLKAQLEKIGAYFDSSNQILITSRETSLKELMALLNHPDAPLNIWIKVPNDAVVTPEVVQQWMAARSQQVQQNKRHIFLKLSQAHFKDHDWYHESGDFIEIRPSVTSNSEDGLLDFVDWLQRLHDENKLPASCWINLRGFSFQTEKLAKKFETLLSSPGMKEKTFLFDLDDYSLDKVVPAMLQAQAQSGPKLNFRFGYINLSAKQERALLRQKRLYNDPKIFTYSAMNYPQHESFRNTTGQFYIALVKMRGVHNLMTIGCVQEDGTAIPCIGAGLQQSNQFRPERLSMQPPYDDSTDDRPQSFTYKAFTLTREQFVDAIENLYTQITPKKKHKLKAYLPTKADPHLFTWQYVENWILEQRNQDEDYLKTLTTQSINSNLSPMNTCRQVAQQGVEQACKLDRNDWGKGVFRKFFFSLPFKGVMKLAGDHLYQTSHRFVVFPKPCHVKEYDGLRKRIMERLELVALDHSELGQLKFNAWKSLYLTLSPAKTSDLEAIKGDIKSWLNQDLSFMTKHRNFIMRTLFPCFDTKSAKLIKAVQEELTPTLKS